MKKQANDEKPTQGSIQPVKRITDSFLGEDGVRYFRVVWKDTWEPELNLLSCHNMIDEFWKSTNKGLKKEEKVKNITEKHNTHINFHCIMPPQDKKKLSKDEKIDTCRNISNEIFKEFKDKCIQWDAPFTKKMYPRINSRSICTVKHDRESQYEIPKEIKNKFLKNKGINTVIPKQDKGCQHDMQKEIKNKLIKKNKSTSTTVKLQTRGTQTVTKTTYSVGTHISDKDFDKEIDRDEISKDCSENATNGFANPNLFIQGQSFIPLSVDNDKEFCDRSTQNNIDNRSRSTQCNPQMEEVGVQMFQYLCSRGVQVNSNADAKQNTNIRISKSNELSYSSVKDYCKFNKPYSIDNTNKTPNHEENNLKRQLDKSPYKRSSTTKYNPIYFITSSSPTKKQMTSYQQDQINADVLSTIQIVSPEKHKQPHENNSDITNNILSTSSLPNVSCDMNAFAQLTGNITPIQTTDLSTQANLLVCNGITSQASFVTNINDDFIAKYWSPTPNK